jgi:hypothetical protein
MDLILTTYLISTYFVFKMPRVSTCMDVHGDCETIISTLEMTGNIIQNIAPSSEQQELVDTLQYLKHGAIILRARVMGIHGPEATPMIVIVDNVLKDLESLICELNSRLGGDNTRMSLSVVENWPIPSEESARLNAVLKIFYTMICAADEGFKKDSLLRSPHLQATGTSRALEIHAQQVKHHIEVLIDQAKRNKHSRTNQLLATNISSEPTETGRLQEHQLPTGYTVSQPADTPRPQLALQNPTVSRGVARPSLPEGYVELGFL